jgi:DNA-binding response OmpR family regulator
MVPTQILIVDPEQADYDCLLPVAAAEGCEVRFLATGRAALRRRREITGGLLIVNVELPDLSGFDLVEMLQPFPQGTAVFLVADQYAVEGEVRALRLGVSSYLCKPLQGAVLHECRSIEQSFTNHSTADHRKDGKEVYAPRTQASRGLAKRDVFGGFFCTAVTGSAGRHPTGPPQFRGNLR